jgi:hypothetical protein
MSPRLLPFVCVVSSSSLCVVLLFIIITVFVFAVSPVSSFCLSSRVASYLCVCPHLCVCFLTFFVVLHVSLWFPVHFVPSWVRVLFVCFSVFCL